MSKVDYLSLIVRDVRAKIRHICKKEIEMAEKLVLDPATDGITHLNIYSQGKTWVGQEASNFAHRPMTLSDHGSFASVEGYWYWLGRQDDRLRHLYGYKAKEMGRSLPILKKWHQEKFESLICEAITAKLEGHPDILQALIQYTLPLTHYYAKYYGSKLVITEPTGSDFILAHFEKIRVAHNPLADCSTMNKLAQRKERAQSQAAEPEGSQLGLF
jgi:hypothetical protein